jgi:hypothetical protein
MKRNAVISLLPAVIAAILLITACGRSDTGGVPVSFNDDWLFIRQDSANADKILPGIIPNHKWEEVTLPHSAFIEPAVVTERQWTGICWYKKIYRPDRRQRHRHTGLLFDGAMQDAIVYLNGAEVARHTGGYLPFYVNLTDDLDYGSENEIMVRLDNRNDPRSFPGMPADEPDFLWYSGLYRNVSLYVTDMLHITAPTEYLSSPGGGIITGVRDVSRESATISLSVHVSNDDHTPRSFRVRNSLLDAAGLEVASSLSEPADLEPGQGQRMMTRMIVMQPALWTPETPFLYTVRTELVSENGSIIDSRETRTGIRSVRMTPDQGLLINGEQVRITGVTRHQEYPYIGFALSDNASYRDAVKIREAGFNLVRCPHYPPAPAFLDACDELGLMVINSLPDRDFTGDSLFADVSVHDAQVMCRRDRNHPSVVLWKITPDRGPIPGNLLSALHQTVKEELPLGNSLTSGRANSVTDVCDPSGTGILAPGTVGEEQDAKPVLRLEPADCLMFDYNTGIPGGLNTSGIMDIFRLPKPAYWFCRSQSEEGPVCFVANRNLPESGNTVKVYSNADTIQLFRNDTLIAVQGPDSDTGPAGLAHPPFTFTLPGYSPGTLRASAVRNGREVASHSVTTPGRPSAMRLAADISNKHLQAGNSDVIFVHATLTDSAGNQVYTGEAMVEFTVRGNAELVGSNPVRAEAGIATILMRAGNPGKIMIKASAPGVSEAELMTESEQ